VTATQTWSGLWLAQLLLATKPSNDRHSTAYQYQGSDCLTRVDLRCRHKALIAPWIVIVPLTVLRFVVLTLVIIASREGEICNQRQQKHCNYRCLLHTEFNCGTATVVSIVVLTLDTSLHVAVSAATGRWRTSPTTT
jgi:hypothetical protein